MLKAHLHLPLFGKVLELIIQSSALPLSKRHRLCRSKATTLSSIFLLHFIAMLQIWATFPLSINSCLRLFTRTGGSARILSPAFSALLATLQIFEEYIFFWEYFEENIFSGLLATLEIFSFQNIVKQIFLVVCLPPCK